MPASREFACEWQFNGLPTNRQRGGKRYAVKVVLYRT